MTHLGTHLTPLRCSGAVGKLDEVEAVLDVRLQLVDGHMGALTIPVLELAGHTHVEYGQRLGTDVLSQLEELEEAQAVRLEIVRIEAVGEGVLPTVLVQRTVLDGTDGVLPLIARGEVDTLNDAAAREAQQAGLGIGQGLCQILTQTVLAVLERIDGEEADVLEVDSLCAAEVDAQLCLVDGLARLHHHLILLPVLRRDVNLGLGELLMLVHRGAVDELHDNLTLSLRSFGPDAEAVVLSLLQANTEEAVVRNA